jgi:signal transduction histidine kinase
MEPRRRIPPLVVDALLALGLLLLGLTSRVEISDSEAASVFSRDPDAVNTILIVLMSVPLALRRMYPVTVLAVTVAAFAVDRVLDYPNTLAGAGIVLAIHAIGSELPLDRSTKIGGSLVVGITAFTVLGAVTLESVGIGSVIQTSLMAAAPLYLGREVHQRRRRFEELTLRAERAEREREEQARQAVAEERARIARELHDVVAHQMAVMTVQAEGARRLARDADPRIRDALDTIRSAGHEALTEMRRMVGLLRTVDEPERPLDPQPGLDRLDELVEQMREAGLDVDVAIDGDLRELPPGVALNAYRIVQESLTNTLKHGGRGASATISITYTDEGIRISVTDDGLGAATALERPAESGHGLIGMRERVALLDGEFDAGPRPGGGYAVTARIPVPT